MKLIEGLVVKAGTTVRFPAIIRGVPIPTAKWTTDGSEIKTDEHYTVETDNFSSVLTIKNCLRRDTGEYQITVSNADGSWITRICEVEGSLFVSYVLSIIYHMLEQNDSA